MTISNEPVKRLQMLAFAYELTPNDLLVNDDDGTCRRVVSTAGVATVTATFDDDGTQDFPRRTLLTIYRDMATLPEAFQGLPPTIVA